MKIALIACALFAVSIVPAGAAPPIEYASVKVAMEHLNHGFDLLERTHCYGPYKHCIIPYGSKNTFDGLTPCTERAGCYGFNICNFPDTFGAKEGTLAASYAEIADVAISYRRALNELGYRSSVAAQTIADFERYEVRRADGMNPESFPQRGRDRYSSGGFPLWDNLYIAIQQDMSVYSRSHPALRGFVPEGGCGGGGIAMTIEAVPQPARIFIIPSFYYEVCKAQGVNPNDMSGCDHWREIIGQSIDDISGEYHYLVRWHDGITRRGVLNADDFAKLSLLGKPLKLSKP
jgi:hypothetical protein